MVRRFSRRAGGAGYSLVVLIMAITVLNIMLAAALPMWSEMIRRDKEEELISRGFQYVEAIRVFQRRFQRYPLTLDELIKVKPRCIRQLYKDPMTQDGQWVLIPIGSGQQLPGAPGTQPPGAPVNPDNPTAPGANGANGTNGTNGTDPTQPLAAFPIVGVHSRSTQKSLLVFYGREHYNEWEFRLDLLSQTLGFHGVGVPGTNMLPGANLSLRWAGRPMPSFGPTPGSGLTPGGSLTPGAPPGAPGGPPGAGGGITVPPAGGKTQ